MNIILLVLFLGFIGMFAGFEVGFYTINPVRLDILAEKKHRPALLLKHFRKHKEHLIISILIGTNLFNYLFSGFLMHSLGSVGQRYRVLLSTLIGTGFGFVFAEVYPKFLFQRYPDLLTYGFVRIIYVFHRIFLPVGYILKLITEFFRKVLRINKSSIDHVYGRKSLVGFIDQAHAMRYIDKAKKDMLFSILRLKDSGVSELAVTPEGVISFYMDDTYEKVMGIIRKYPYKRYPVLDRKTGRVLKILNVLHLFWNETDWACLKDLSSLLNDPVFISSQDSLLTVMQKMQSRSSVMAVIVNGDKYSGIVTLRDIINGAITKVKDL